MGMVGYEFARPGMDWAGNHLYSYVAAANGLFISAQRQGLHVLLPLTRFKGRLHALQKLEPVLYLVQRVPLDLLRLMITHSRRVMPNEALFYLWHDGSWKISMPDQHATQGTVKPVDDYPPGDVLIEVHSHNSMPACFSSMDDRDETGFKVYGVLGKLQADRPELALRVGVYGHFVPVTIDQVFEVEKWN